MSKLSINDSNTMIGGFSSSFSLNDSDTLKITNNCNGGNYKAGCGKNKIKKNKKTTGTNSNCVGNCVVGCGK